MSDTLAETEFKFNGIIEDICQLNWSSLTTRDMIAAAWAPYFFSIQFRENLQIACSLYPHDAKLAQLEKEECSTDNLSPWPGVAAAGEKMDHDEFMRRLLVLSPIEDETRRQFQAWGEQYLLDVRATDPQTRALSIASYEDGGLEAVFRAMLRSPDFDNALLGAFRHFLSEHIRFDSDPDQGHGALSRHMRPDDRIYPLWNGFKNLLIQCAPALAARTD